MNFQINEMFNLKYILLIELILFLDLIARNIWIK